MEPDFSYLRPRYVESLSDRHLVQAVAEYRRAVRILDGMAKGRGAFMVRHFRDALAVYEAEIARRKARRGVVA